MHAPRQAAQLAMAAQARAWAHSLGNPLAGLLLTLESLDQATLPPAGAGQVGRCLHAAERLLELQRTLSLLGTGAQPGRTDVPLAAAWQAAIDSLPPAVRPRTCTQLRPQGATVWANEVLLSVVLRALADNAARAVGAGGRVELSGRPRGQGYELWVADDGPGVPAALRQQLFVSPCPRDGASCGMGLLTAALIVEQVHGGELAYEPRPSQQGACFRLFWPHSPTQSAPCSPAMPAGRASA